MRTYTFEIEDTSYTLKYDYNAICDIETKAEKPISKIFSEELVGLNTVRMLLWGGLKWRNQGISLQQVGFMIEKLIALGLYQEVSQKAMECLVNAVPKGNSEELQEGE